MQEDFRVANGHALIIQLLQQADDDLDLAHRILLMLQVLADKETDRKALLAAGAADAVRPYLSENHSQEV